jgi:two-component system, sensor histidine kinase and response regulator
MTTILVIDDDRIVRQTLFAGLKQSNDYEVLQAANGHDGLELARERHPDLIICDIEMPRLNGYNVIEQLQQDPATSRIPFIFLTSHSDHHSMRQGMILGADDYIAKPFKISELLEAVQTRLAKVSRIEMHYAQKMDALRDNILLALPHELRTPLSLIIGFGEVLSDQAASLPTEKIAALAKSITRSGRRLQNLFENYIIYAQIELLMTEPERIALMRQFREAQPGQIIERVVRKLMDEYGRSAHLTLDPVDLRLPISTNNLEKIATELIDNAFKFSPAHTAISVTTQHNSTANLYTLQIVNQGHGMTREQIAAIGGYMQFERKIHEQQGTGMGLIIAKRLTELYGGVMTIESIPDVETKITVTLPA